MKNKTFKLCYINDNFAYFTSDFENQWGDDWNDIPYEHNAGSPYEKEGREIKIIAFMTDLETPEEIFYPNSELSVEGINSGLFPWLSGMSYELEEHVEIYGGATIEEFIDFIINSGGRVFEEVKRIEIE